MKYKVQLWQYGFVRQEFETDNRNEAICKLVTLYNFYDECGIGWTTMYIDGERISTDEKFDFMEEYKGN